MCIYTYTWPCLLCFLEQSGLSNPPQQRFRISNLGPIFLCWTSMGSLRISRNHKTGGQGLGPWAGPGQGPRTQARAPLEKFLEILRLPMDLQRMHMGSKLLI